MILITGAGTIGKGLAQELLNRGEEVCIFSRGENTLYDTLYSLDRKDVKSVVGDVRDKRLVEWVVKEYKPDIIYHTAASKHVHISEANPIETITNNVFGTLNLVETGVRVVLVSTDKALSPINVYGMSKAVAEQICHDQIIVRCGNIVNSRGSVIPLFMKQIREGKALTVTHKEASRYFMSLEEAVKLIMYAGETGNGREVFFQDLGRMVPIKDIAQELKRLYGAPNDIIYTHLRAGEKIKEQFESYEIQDTIRADTYKTKLEKRDITELLRQLKKTCDNYNEEGLRDTLYDFRLNWQEDTYRKHPDMSSATMGLKL